MRKHYLFLGILATLILFISCQKDQVGGITLTLKSGDYHHVGNKCYINSEGYSCWEAGDRVYLSSITPHQIEINSQSTATIRDITSMPPYMALFTSYKVFDFRSVGNPYVFFVHVPANDYYGVNASGKQQINAPMCAYMDNAEDRTLQFYNVFALMSFNLGTGIFGGDNSDISSYNILEYIEVESDKALSGYCLINPRTGEVSHQILDGSQNMIAASATQTSYIRRLVVNEALSNEDKTYYLPIPPVSDARFTVTLGLKTPAGDHVRITKNATQSNTVEGNTIIPALSSSNFTTSASKSRGVLSGVFTVNGSGKKVRFAQGNFLCDGRDNWTLEHEQFGVKYTNYSGQNGVLGNCSHFGWCSEIETADGTFLGGNFGNDTQTEFRNGVTITASWEYAFRAGEYDSDDDGFVRSNDPYAYQFTVLSASEYSYLLNSRVFLGALHPRNSNWATVDGTPGLLLFPDEFDLPEEISTINGTSLQLSLGQWYKMQAAGAVFLPAAGKRWGNSFSSSFYGNSYVGFYWTSTPDGNMGKALEIYSNINFGSWNTCSGCSVRFVKVI